MKDLIIEYKREFSEKNIQNKIEKYGCCLVRGIYEDISELKEVHNSYFEEYEDAYFTDIPKRENIEFKPKYFNSNGLRIDGCPIEHRLMRGQGCLNLKESTHRFFGKRASIPWEKISADADPVFITEALKKCIRSALELDEDQLTFMLGSFNRVYPRYTGESGVLHIDTFGFTNNSNLLTNDNTKPTPFLNAIVYLTEANQEVSGTRFIRGSHNQYQIINEIVSKALRKNSKSNNIHQREIYDELLSDVDGISEIEQVIAKPGDVFLFSSSLIHGIPGNQSFDKTRDVAIFNFGKKNSPFGKVFHKKTKLSLEKRCNSVGISLASKRPKYITTADEVLKGKLKKGVRQSLNYFNRFKRSFYFSCDKRLLNIGAGDYFKLKGWDRLDYDGDAQEDGIRIKRLKDINFDLSKKSKIPLKDNQYDGIYSSHTFEHLKKNVSIFNLNECYRLLKSGGVLRLCLPDINRYFDAYDARDLHFFNWIRDKNIYYYDSWLRMIVREMSGTVVDNFTDDELTSLYQTLDRENFILFFEDKTFKDERKLPALPDVHKSAWSVEETKSILIKIGFKDIQECPYTKSKFAPFNGTFSGQINSTRPHLSFAIEAIK